MSNFSSLAITVQELLMNFFYFQYFSSECSETGNTKFKQLFILKTTTTKQTYILEPVQTFVFKLSWVLESRHASRKKYVENNISVNLRHF